MGNIIEASALPLEEKVYLKKDIFGYRVIEPIKDIETGKWNWFNLLVGGKRNLVLLIFLLLLASVSYLGMNELIFNYQKVADNPCSFCSDCQEQVRAMLSNMKYNSFNKINLTFGT